jgi:predicted ABC-type sugar transport system permease subunit
MIGMNAFGSADGRRLMVLAVALVVVLVVGTAGYVIIEGWSVFEAFYMVVITLSTVGFREVRDISDAGRLFTILLILGGVSILGGTGTVVGAMLAAIFLNTITKALVFLDISPFWTRAIQGLLILITVLADLYRRHRQSA